MYFLQNRLPALVAQRPIGERQHLLSCRFDPVLGGIDCLHRRSRKGLDRAQSELVLIEHCASADLFLDAASDELHGFAKRFELLRPDTAMRNWSTDFVSLSGRPAGRDHLQNAPH